MNGDYFFLNYINIKIKGFLKQTLIHTQTNMHARLQAGTYGCTKEQTLTNKGRGMYTCIYRHTLRNKIQIYVKNNNMAVEISRKNVLVRDNYECQYCGKKSKSLTVDHIIPKFRNGQDTWENLVAACKNCNQTKGEKTPEEANMPLVRKPKRPNRIHYFQRLVKKKQADWRPYLFMEPLN